MDFDLGGGIDIGKYMPDFSSLGSSLLYSILIIIVMAVIAFLGYFYWDSLKYKYKIEIYENLGGTRYVKSAVDVAKLVNVGSGGEQLLWLKKHKCYRTAYARKMGKNLIWFAVGQDGYWYNIQLGDLDAKQGELDIEPIDRDMRYTHVAIRKNTEARYTPKPKFMEKYGVAIFGFLFFILLIFGLYFLIGQISEAASALAGTAETNRQVLDSLKQVIVSMDNICSSSGVR